MDYKEIANKLLTAFNNSPDSYADLAQKTGIPKSALQRYITGDTEKIPLVRLRIICEKLGLDSAEVIGWVNHDSQRSHLHTLVDRIPEEKAALVIRVLESILEDDQK